MTPQGADGLSLARTGDPCLPPGHVLVEVAAAGVNRADLLQRAGHYPPPPGVTDVLGLEVSGTVAAVADDVAGWRAGDRVCALVDGGGYAERVAVPAGQVMPVPDGIDLVDAAALPEAACTAWSTLVGAARLRAQEWLLVQGGSGGVGSHAVQLATALGARVVATAGGPGRAERCRVLGAEVALDHRADDVAARVDEVTAGRGVDVVLDVLGGAALGANVRLLATGGRLAVIGLQRGRRGELDLGALLTRRATVLGTTLRSRPPDEKAAIVADVVAHVWPHVAAGRVRPVVHARLPLAQAGRAHELLDSGEVFGKLLLLP